MLACRIGPVCACTANLWADNSMTIDIGGFGLFLASVSHDSEHHTYNGPNEHRFIRFETPDWVKNAKDHYLKQAKKSPCWTRRQKPWTR